jgi:hypothetical protein
VQGMNKQLFCTIEVLQDPGEQTDNKGLSKQYTFYVVGM